MIDVADKIIVTKLTKHPDGYWTANVHRGDAHAAVDTRHGTWQTKADGVRREVRPEVAAALQERLPARERGRR